MDDAAPEFPPICNTGGNFHEASTNVVVDWVSVSMPISVMSEGIGSFLAEVRRLFDGTIIEFRQRAGLHGYRWSVVSDEGGVVVAWGGNRDTLFLQIPGNGCARVACFCTLHDFILHRCGHLTRIDLAFDDFGGTHDVGMAVELYRSGAFVGRAGGARSGASRVSCSQVGNWIDTSDGKGRTFYVGKLANGKMLCVYEKGRQLGDPSSPWVRWEVRLANRDRALPLEALVEPAQFARGSYPALAFIGGPEQRIASRRQSERITLAKLTHHARDAYGPLLDVLARSGVEAGELVERIRRDGFPRRLGAPTDADLVSRGNALFAEALEAEINEVR